jgi:ureidoglycolate lyase
MSGVGITDIGAGLRGDLGRILGAPWDTRPPVLAWRGPVAEFRHDAPFDPGEGGVVEVLQVACRDPGPVVARVERHLLTEQALVVTGALGLAQVLARHLNGRPDPWDLIALRLEPGQGVVMARGVWLATLAPFGPAQGMMLTRASTTADLADHLNSASALRETELVELACPVTVALRGQDTEPQTDRPVGFRRTARAAAVPPVRARRRAAGGGGLSDRSAPRPTARRAPTGRRPRPSPGA